VPLGARSPQKSIPGSLFKFGPLKQTSCWRKWGHWGREGGSYLREQVRKIAFREGDVKRLSEIEQKKNKPTRRI